MFIDFCSELKIISTIFYMSLLMGCEDYYYCYKQSLILGDLDFFYASE